MKEATCSTCGKPITWVKSELGRAMPLSLESVAKRIVVGRDGVGRIVDAYLSHFADCVNAAEHRKPAASDQLSLPEPEHRSRR